MLSASPVSDTAVPDIADIADISAASAAAAVTTPPPTPPAQQDEQQENEQQQDEQQQHQDEHEQEQGEEQSSEARRGYNVQVHHEPEEVAQRLFAAPVLPDLAKEVSGMWGWVSSKATKLAEEAAKQAEELSKSVIETAGEQRSMFESEKDRFMAQPDTLVENDDISSVFKRGRGNSSSVLTDAAEAAESATGPLPWLPKSEYTDAIKTQVLRLSEDDNSFLVPPPEEVDFSFDFDASAGLALALLEVDSNLSGKRFSLVPKQVKETEFWHHYFYRVHLIQEAYGHTSFAPNGTASGDATHNTNESRGVVSDRTGGEGEGGNGSPDGDQLGKGHGLDDDDDERRAALEAGAKGHEMTRSSHVEGEFHAQDAGNDKTQQVDEQDHAGVGSTHWEDELRAELDFDDENFDMVDMDDDGDEDDNNDDSIAVNDGMGHDSDDDDDDDALALEERIRAELDLEAEDSF